MLIKIFIPCLLFFSTLICHGQSDPILLSDYFKNAQKGISSSFSKGSLKELPVANFIAETAPYLRSESTFVRYKAIDLIRLKGILSAPEDRILLVELLVQACKDPDGANSGVASNALLLFNRADFSSRSIDSLVTALYSTDANIEKILRECDLIVGAVLLPGAKAPTLVKREQLRLMKKGAVIVDVAVDQGGCVETIHPTTHDNPVYVVDGIVHYAVANMPGSVALTSTKALTSATLPYGLLIAELGLEQAVKKSPALRPGVNVYQGKLVYENVSKAFNMPYIPIDSLI